MTQSLPTPPNTITVGELIARYLEASGVRAAFGVVSIHNLPILDAFFKRQHLPQGIRFVPARGEAGACNMADAYARVTRGTGVFVTSTGTGAGNAAGALVEAMTAGTPMLHLTGQIDSEYVDLDYGFIHEAPDQLGMLKAVSKAAYRIRNPQTALAILKEASRVAHTAPCGPVSIEIAIDVQKAMLPEPHPAELKPVFTPPVAPDVAMLDTLAQALLKAERPVLWLGGGARGASLAAQRFADMGWAIVTSVQGRGILPEDRHGVLGAFNSQKPIEAFYASCDALLAVGTRLRSNETLRYQLKLPRALYRIDANPLAQGRGYASDLFLHGDAQLSLDALADRLEGQLHLGAALQDDAMQAKAAAQVTMNHDLGPYTELKTQVERVFEHDLLWVRDITLSNSMWGNRLPRLSKPTQGVHALGGGIGQGLSMAIGAEVANQTHGLQHHTVALIGDGGFMLNVGELAACVQERAHIVMIVMNDSGYGVIKNIQDDLYGARHGYVDLVTPKFAALCESLGVHHLLLSDPKRTEETLRAAQALQHQGAGAVMVEVDMKAWGAFNTKFAGPPLKKAPAP